jgi:hypothetical protein
MCASQVHKVDKRFLQATLEHNLVMGSEPWRATWQL